VTFALMTAVLALPAAARADPSITAACNGAPCSSGWYTNDVTVVFTLPPGSTNPQGCGTQTIAQDTAGYALDCVVTLPNTQCCHLPLPIKRDATAPTANAITAARSPDNNGWYNHSVGVATSGTDAMSGIASCTTVTYAGPDSSSASVSGTCTDNAGNVSAPMTLTFQYDATPPSVSATPGRAADAGGWYNHSVDVAFSATDAVSGVDTCTSASYSGPDNGSASVSGSCRDKAGNTAAATFALRYDSTPPSITGGTPDRAPDANGWYNHHLVVTFAGTDATSGIAACDTPAYDKPDDATATVTGRCRDNAGNESPPASFAFKFDSTPPKISGLALSSLDRTIALTWKASTDVATVKIVRTGGGSAAPVTVYDGKRATAFNDKRVRNGDRYSYVLTASDAAGNAAILKGLATPSAPLIAPREAARVSSGATLRWRAVPKASYYNVQLWLRGKKVLTTWPAGPSFRLPHLLPGRYTWFVWPGLGPRSRHHYGALIGKSTFVVTR
jgi:hypothetical protein